MRQITLVWFNLSSNFEGNVVEILEIISIKIIEKWTLNKYSQEKLGSKILKFLDIHGILDYLSPYN